MFLFRPSAQHGAYPPELYRLKRAQVMKDLPEFSRLSDFLDAFVLRQTPGEREVLGASSAAICRQIEEFDYRPAIAEARQLWARVRAQPTNRDAAGYMFFYRAVARHIVSLYLHIEQYQRFIRDYDSTKNFLDQYFGLARESVPEPLETLVLETEKATRGYLPEDDTVQLLTDSKLSFVLAYPDYAAAYLRPGCDGSSVHHLDPAAYNLGGDAEKYFKLLHVAVESKLGPLMKAAQSYIDGDASSAERAKLINAAADAATAATSTIIKMPELSHPSEYLHLRWFIQGPYGSPSYPNGLSVRGVRIRPGGETGSQSSFAIVSDLVSGVRFHFKDDSLCQMEKIHRVTREHETIAFVDRLREAAGKCKNISAEEKNAKAKLLQATNFYLLGHAAAYTLHVLAQQKSTVMVEDRARPDAKSAPEAKRPRKEDVATGGSAGSFLIKKVIERQEYLEKMIVELDGTSAPFAGKQVNEQFKKQLDIVKAHTQGDRCNGLDITILRNLVGFSEEKAVGIP